MVITLPFSSPMAAVVQRYVASTCSAGAVKLKTEAACWTDFCSGSDPLLLSVSG